MAAKDIYHDEVVNALVQDGWVITDDPYIISVGQKRVFIDLGAERLLAAQRNNEQIAVEIKSFRNMSEIYDLERALGQYVLYHSLLQRIDPQRKLFLAIPHTVYENIFLEPIARPVLEDLNMHIVTFDPKKEQIIKWIT